jgi:hypothetical protein
MVVKVTLAARTTEMPTVEIQALFKTLLARTENKDGEN